MSQVRDTHGSYFSFSIFKYPHVKWAVIAQFFYVGAQVGVGSFFIRFSRFVLNMPEKDAAYRWGTVAMVGFMVGRFTGTFLMRFIKPPTLLSIYAVVNTVLLAIGILAHGEMAVYAVMAVPFFMSIMFHTIFALCIKELGEETTFASSFLLMSIIGGALVRLFVGKSPQDRGMQVAISRLIMFSGHFLLWNQWV
jgi:FHS family L-fucose permease-like MFS transporter